MKVVIAIDSFKGSVSSIEASKAISLGVKDVYHNAEIIALPLADGGEGTVDALVHSTGGYLIKKEVMGPLKDRVIAEYGILGDRKTAVIEVAAACGIPLVPIAYRNPSLTTTYGVGELIKDALSKGCREFVVGLGGSSTNDAGVGMLQALGFQFLDKNNQEVGFGGKVLSEIATINLDNVEPLLKDCTFKVACDVKNALYGPQGASYIFGPQKGATPEMVRELDDGLMYFAQIVQEKLNIEIHNTVGAGAAGGLGAAFSGFLHAQLASGVDLVLESIGLEQKLKNADFVITGEGQLDLQTSMGKAPNGVAQMAKKFKVPVIALAGSVTDDVDNKNDSGFTSYFSILNSPMPIEKAIETKRTAQNLRSTTKQLFRLIQAVTIGGTKDSN